MNTLTWTWTHAQALLLMHTIMHTHTHSYTHCLDQNSLEAWLPHCKGALQRNWKAVKRGKRKRGSGHGCHGSYYIEGKQGKIQKSVIFGFGHFAYFC